MKKNKQSTRTGLKLSLGIVVLLALALVLLEVTHVFDIFPRSRKAITSPIITSLQPHQTNSHTPAASSFTQGTSTDQKGSGTVSTPSSDWATSTSGLLTLKQPVSGAKVSSGFVLIGSSSVSPVQYRLIDSISGVISVGSITVYNGSFSASISLKNIGTSGRLDVFNTASSGKEINEVQIPVGFK